MSFKIGFGRSRRSILAYSVLAISVVAALSSVGVVFAQASTNTTTTSTGSQTSAGSQSTSSGSSSSVNCPNMGSHAGNSATTAAATARYSA